jgi:hypothetical protein
MAVMVQERAHSNVRPGWEDDDFIHATQGGVRENLLRVKQELRVSTFWTNELAMPVAHRTAAPPLTGVPFGDGMDEGVDYVVFVDYDERDEFSW